MMRKMNRCSLLFAGLLALLPLGTRAGIVEIGNEAPWNVNPSVGWIDFEGDQVVKDGFIAAVHLAYDFNRRWTIEGVGYLAPNLEASKVELQSVPGTYRPGLDADSTWMIGAALDGLWHFTRWDRVDPYLTLGVGVFHLGEKPQEGAGDEQTPVSVRGGGGLMYHFNDEWAVRADWRGLLSGQNSEANQIVTVGISWTWGAHVPPKFKVVGGPKDSDGDGLSDKEEIEIYKTDPFNKDTDDDGLTDYEEVKVYRTNPREPDTDYDGLKDGPEVYTYETDPLVRDTDKGGVADGHEVIEDGTNPLNGKDDLIRFELDLKFEYDKAIIRSEFYPQLEVIGRTLERDPGSTARIEGHADKLKKSVKKYNDELSERRAKAVLDFLADKCGIDRSRMIAVGYGYSRPQAPNDPGGLGNPVNRRVEVYVRPSGHTPATNATVKVNFPSRPPAVSGGATNAAKSVLGPATGATAPVPPSSATKAPAAKDPTMK